MIVRTSQIRERLIIANTNPSRYAMTEPEIIVTSTVTMRPSRIAGMICQTKSHRHTSFMRNGRRSWAAHGTPVEVLPRRHRAPAYIRRRPVLQRPHGDRDSNRENQVDDEQDQGEQRCSLQQLDVEVLAGGTISGNACGRTPRLIHCAGRLTARQPSCCERGTAWTNPHTISLP